MGPRDGASSVEERLSRVTRSATGDRLEAYATVRRRLVAGGSWRHRRDALERSLDTPASSVGLSQGVLLGISVSAFRKGSDVTLDLDLGWIGIHQSRSSIRRARF